MKRKIIVSAKTILYDLLKVILALSLFFFIFYLIAPAPDLPEFVKEDIKECIQDHTTFFSPQSIEAIFEKSISSATDNIKLSDRIAGFACLFFFWSKHAVFEEFGRPLRSFGNTETPSIADSLIPYFRKTFVLSVLGSLFGILFSLTVSIWYVNSSWNIALNRKRSFGTIIIRTLSLLSNIPSCILTSFFLFYIVSRNYYDIIWLKYFICGVIIGYSDGVFCILATSLNDEFRAQYQKTYIAISATRGSPNISLKSFNLSLAGKALRNVFEPVVSIFRQRISIILGMSIIVEIIFNIEGLGLKSWKLIHVDSNGDYFLIMGIFSGFALLWFILSTICNTLLIAAPKTHHVRV